MAQATRRAFVAGAAATGAGVYAASRLLPARTWLTDRRPRRSRVAILRAERYGQDLEDIVLQGLKLVRYHVRGKSVLLKPNLVEYIPGVEVNTNAVLVGATVDAMLRLGASEVVVAEGPGHQRDTYLVLVESGLDEQLLLRRVRFVDLNRDDLAEVQLRACYAGLKHLWLPRTVLRSDVIVSMPKVKTHHWAGVTLSMKNMFGIVPGAAYGWPKNILHWQGIHESILDICATVRPHIVIADGVVAMEGNGPLQGTNRQMNRIVISDDPVAADFTCCHLMGLVPERIPHLAEAANWLGNGSPGRIEQAAEGLPSRVRPFGVLPEFANLVDR